MRRKSHFVTREDETVFEFREVAQLGFLYDESVLVLPMSSQGFHRAIRDFLDAIEIIHSDIQARRAVGANRYRNLLYGLLDEWDYLRISGGG
jgi:hypothetical protein